MTDASTPRLENWSVTVVGDAYTPPELWRTVLAGDVYGHPHHEDGKRIHTSSVRTGNAKLGTVQTTSRVYVLGQVDPEYERAHPNARERFFNRLA